MAVTALYASLLAFFFVLLAIRVVAARREAKVSLGTGNDPNLLRRVRSHANAAEYIPLALILMGLAESLKAPDLLLHVIGIALVLGRIVHAYALAVARLDLRVAGMMLTFTAITLAALYCFVFGTFNLVI